MLEAINNTINIREVETNSARMVPTKTQDASNRSSQPDQNGAQARKNEKDIEVSQALLEELEEDIQKMHNLGLQFSKHEPTGRTMVKVIDKDTNETLREFPPEKVLDFAAKMDEVLGILFDKKV